MAGTLTKSVSLKIVADSATAKETLDDIAAKAGDLNGKKSTLLVNVHAGDTKAQLDEITAKADALGIKNIRFNVKADTADANAKLDQTKLKADSLGKGFLGAALSITGFNAAQDAASSGGDKFKLAMAGLNLATGVAEPLMAGLGVAVGGLASGFVAAGAGIGVFGLVAKQAYSQVSTAVQAFNTAQSTTGKAAQKDMQIYQADLAALSPSQQRFAQAIIGAQSAWQAFINRATPGVTQVLNSGLKLLPPLFQAMATFLKPTEAALGTLINDLSRAINPVTQVTEAVGRFRGETTQLVKGGGGFQSWIKAFADNAGPAIVKLGIAIGHIVVGIGGILKAFLPMSQTMLGGVDKITGAFAKWGTTLSSHTGFQSMMSMFKTETPLAVKTLENLAKAVVGIVKAMTGLDGVGNSKTLLQILEPLSGLLAKLANGNPILDRTVLYLLAATDAGKKLKNVFSGLQSGVSVLKDIGDGASNFSKGFKDADQAAAEATGTWGTIGGKVSGLGSMFQQAALKMGLLRTATVEGTEAQEGLDVAMEANPLGLIITGIVLVVAAIVILVVKVKAFRDFWIDVWNDIKKIFDDVWGYIKQHWPMILGILTGPIGIAVVEIIKHWKGIQQGFEDAWNAIKSFFTTTWHDIVDGVSTMNNNIIGFVAKLPGRVVNALASLYNDMMTIGKNMVIGLWNGIVSLGSWLYNQIVGFVESFVKNPVKAVLSIFSPSKVFHGYGQNIVLGLVAGIESMRGLARGSVSRLANDVAQGFNPNLTMPGGSAATIGRGGNTFNVTIPVQGLVGDAGSTGRQIAEALNTYLRQTGQTQLVGR